MKTRPLQFRCPGPFTYDELRKVEAAAVRIVEEIGIDVADPALHGRLRKRGFRASGRRIRIDSAAVTDFLEAERSANGRSFSVEPEAVEASAREITLYPSPYPQFVHDPATDRIVPFDTERLVEATKLVDVLAGRGLAGGAPGCPTDAAPALQPVLQYWISATYSRSGSRPVDSKGDPTTFRYVRAMGEALGRPPMSLPIYVFSPLTLSGESLRCALLTHGLSGVHVSDMASLGCTTPVMPGDAFALCAAEVVGAAMLVGALTDVPVSWDIRLCPADLRYMSMALGTPEDFHLDLANHQVNGFLHGRAWRPSVNVHTMAKLPDAQACTEKASLMTVGSLLGVRRFGSAGTLSLDEVFSPEQLIYDLEMKDHAERMSGGMDWSSDPEACLAQVREGIGERTFAGLERTRDSFRDVYWHPVLFERTFLKGWEASGGRPVREKARAQVQELVRQHEFELDAVTQRELDRVLEAARRELG